MMRLTRKSVSRADSLSSRPFAYPHTRRLHQWQPHAQAQANTYATAPQYSNKHNATVLPTAPTAEPTSTTTNPTNQTAPKPTTSSPTHTAAPTTPQTSPSYADGATTAKATGDAKHNHHNAGPQPPHTTGNPRGHPVPHQKPRRAPLHSDISPMKYRWVSVSSGFVFFACWFDFFGGLFWLLVSV